MDLIHTLDSALAAREAFFDEKRLGALRLFNGFLEGFPDLSLDLYARSLLIHNYAAAPQTAPIAEVQAWALERLPWLQAILVKTRHGQTDQARRGHLTFGTTLDRKILENGVWYALDLTMNRDASLYVDTRNLRVWARKNLGEKTLLNTFAYTGSLGAAALAGGATRVVQLDRNREFLNLAKTTYTLNGFPIRKSDFLAADFFPAVSQLKRAGASFDCVFLDPPFFASTSKGTVDLETGSSQLINKIRPLIADGGWLVAINNALFVSGKAYLASLEALCADGYLSLEELLPIPADCTGFPQTKIGNLPVDPAPFNHATKIAILRVRRK
jgi:23S rRNA (cytosine1962-C5)-methyltransferase